MQNLELAEAGMTSSGANVNDYSDFSPRRRDYLHDNMLCQMQSCVNHQGESVGEIFNSYFN